MPRPGEHKTVQNRILTYAEQIGWNYVSRSEAETRQGFDRVNGTIQKKRNRLLSTLMRFSTKKLENLTRNTGNRKAH